jgi:hypothetical protein
MPLSHLPIIISLYLATLPTATAWQHDAMSRNVRSIEGYGQGLNGKVLKVAQPKKHDRLGIIDFY